MQTAAQLLEDAFTVRIAQGIPLSSASLPRPALTYMIGEINYGGRVTDPWDQRCILSLLRRFIDPVADAADYVDSPSVRTVENLEADLGLRAGGEGDDAARKVSLENFSFVDFGDALRIEDHPSIYGLHPNGAIANYLKQSNELLDPLVAMQPRASGSSSGESTNFLRLELVEH